MKKKVFLFLLFCVCSLPGLSHGKDDGFVFVSSGMAYGPGDAPWIYEFGANGCFVYEKYIVKVSDYRDPGEDIIVYKRDNNRKDMACITEDPLHIILTIIPKEFYGVKEFNGFYGIFKNRMFVNTGTYEFGRILDIYNLDTGKRIYISNFNHVVKKAKGWAVSFWRTKKTFKNDSECPNKISCEYGSPKLEENITLDLSDFKERVKDGHCYCPA